VQGAADSRWCRCRLLQLLHGPEDMHHADIASDVQGGGCMLPQQPLLPGLQLGPHRRRTHRGTTDTCNTWFRIRV